MSKVNLQLTEHFRRSEWLPASDAHLQKWMKDAVDEQTKKMNASSQSCKSSRAPFLVDAGPRLPDAAQSLQQNYPGMPFYGPIGPPMYMVLSGAMNTQGGFTTFLNTELNAQFKRMFDVWAKFLDSPASRYVLTADPGGSFSSAALTALMANFDGLRFEQIFVCDPFAQHWGYKSWDDFFVRTFQPGIHALQAPENPDIINAACESQLYNLAQNGELHSLFDILNHDEYAAQFMGGTVFQGFLSVTGYHRRYARVTGVVRRVVPLPGTYFCQSPATLEETDNPYLRSLSFITALTTRALVFIESDNPSIGLMCFIAVGMTEVSTCETPVKEGDRVTRGDELGMFHFGGSTHVLIFRPEMKLQFFDDVDNPGPGDMVEVRTAITGVV
ncbi:phosphatidylserine decarboxylase [Mycena maculata]|uniref:Phosphatidylserine decarboxylase n=1 Tax=Mycena maculata TaxID=230809 RepID=A0AAD7NHH2_9AGAR|nr:phosphatidylserine decarboxylase [Mycena maculata]